MTKQLSPEAQAVLNAVKADLDNAPWAEDSTMIAALSTAAVALRAAAKPFHWTWNAEMCHKHLITIAKELEAQ